MPGKLKVRVLAARDLPVMDRASDLADAFVEVRFGQATHKTEVFRKSLNPHWDTDWFKFEVDDEELQDEPLQLRILDYDTYSAHDTIGKVYIDLNPLLWKDGVAEIAGWMPIFDTMHGIRGEINVIVKVDLIEDANKFRDSSCGVEFFSSTRVPVCYTLEAIHGFVEELVVNDDPEYQWIDMIRTPRASNEARQRLFSKLTGELQRKIGLKVLELDGNSVIGYNQRFDLEGESGIVVRGIGTVATLQKAPPSTAVSPSQEGASGLQPLDELGDDVANRSPVQLPPQSPTKQGPFQYSSNTDLSNTPLGLLGSSGGSGGLSKQTNHPQGLLTFSIDRMEFPFFTITNFPTGFLVKLGGVVTARSVKLLDRIHNPDEPETRDAWWTEIRTEIRSHAIAMGCHAVVGYKETTSIFDEICLLSATGTAAVVKLSMQETGLSTSLSMERQDFQQATSATPPPPPNDVQEISSSDSPSSCSLCHIPYNDAALPFSVSLTSCNICRRHKVPDVLFTTLEPPDSISYTGKGCCIQARVCKAKRKAQGENNAAIISDALPFVEFELHRQLMNKLKVKGMNALFGLRVMIEVGENVIFGTATATASYITALPAPSPIKISYKQNTKDGEGKQQSEKMQQRLLDLTAKNKELYELYPQEPSVDIETKPLGSAEDVNDPQLNIGFKETFVIEVDEAEDSQHVTELFEANLPKGFYSCSTDVLPGSIQLSHHIQTATLMRSKSLLESGSKSLTHTFNQMIQSLCFKLRKHTPCCLCKLSFNISLSEDDMAYIWLTTAALKVRENTDTTNEASASDGDMMFPIEGVIDSHSPSTSSHKRSIRDPRSRFDKRIYLRDSFWTPAVQITPLSDIPNGAIEKYLGYINIFFIRECTSVRESGGVGGFMQSFISEVNAIIRGHVAALGGNVLVAYTLVDFVLMDNPNKNQCQGLVNVSGDAVYVQYDSPPSGNVSGTDTGSVGSRTPIIDRLQRAS